MSSVNGRVVLKEPTTVLDPSRHLEYIEENIDLSDILLNGGVLAKQLLLSPDPITLEHITPGGPIAAGQSLRGYGISVVLRSDSPAFSEGDIITGLSILWEHYTVYTPSQISLLKAEPSVPLSAYLGILGMPGQTAYLALRDIANLKAGETLFVSAASGAVGSLVVQLAKRAGLKVVGSAGRADKVAYVKDELGADVCFNYKIEDTGNVLSANGPIDVYFDNVGGATLDAALSSANTNGRFITCGVISKYGENGETYRMKNWVQFHDKQLTLRGFSVHALLEKYGSKGFYTEITPLVKSGELKYKEWRTNGLEFAPQALADFVSGRNFGKAIVVVAECPPPMRSKTSCTIM